MTRAVRIEMLCDDDGRRERRRQARDEHAQCIDATGGRTDDDELLRRGVTDRPRFRRDGGDRTTRWGAAPDLGVDHACSLVRMKLTLAAWTEGTLAAGLRLS